MARQKGSFTVNGAIEIGASAPIDARTVVKTKADLLDPDSYPYKYLGLVVSVQDEGKLYLLINTDTTQESSWREIGAGGSGGSGSVDLTGYAKIEDIPEKVSELNNDSGYQTATEVNSIVDAKLQGHQPTITIDDALDDTSENPVQNKVVKEAIDNVAQSIGDYDYMFSWDSTTQNLILNEGTDDEQKLRLSGLATTSSIPDVSGFVKSEDLATVATTGSYNDLLDKPSAVSEYDDTEIRSLITSLQSALANCYTKEETDNIVTNINGMTLLPVATLPTQDIKTNVIYLVNDSLVENNIYSEYIYVDDSWEKIGSATIDLSDYYTKDEVDTAISNVDSSSFAAQDADVNEMINAVFGN